MSQRQISRSPRFNSKILVKTSENVEVEKEKEDVVFGTGSKYISLETVATLLHIKFQLSSAI